MNKSTLGVSLALVPLLAMFSPLRPAQVIPTGVAVAVVNGQRLSNESAEGKAATGRLQTLQQEKAADLRARQQALEATRGRLSQTTDAQERSRLQAEEVQRRGEVERAVVQAQVDIQNLQRQIAAELHARVRSVLDDLLKGTPVQLVIQSENTVVWSAPQVDLTDAVLARLGGSEVVPVQR